MAHAAHTRNQHYYFDLTKIRVGWPHATKTKMSCQMTGHCIMLHWGTKWLESMESNDLGHQKCQLSSEKMMDWQQKSVNK